VQILTGVKEGEMAVFGGQSRYRNGELVKPQVVTPEKPEKVE